MSESILSKVYEPKQVEEKWYQYWEENKFFHANSDTDKPTFTIVIPPPNVTGMLTMGHILNNSVQDLLIRWKKMQGYETLWMPGTDHAGIATQNKVEAALQEDDKTRYDLGREAFLQRVWEWKEKYGGIILQQLRKLGASCDWDRECFTMDDHLSKAVREVFVSLYEKGLIYRGRRLINWCPYCHTALSDEEVENKEETGGFWELAYPLSDNSGEIVVVTTRPETMLGDTAVAVHPEDERYTHLIGKTVKLPLMERDIPIIADEHADPELGSGAVKITPAHDFNDFEVGQRHNLKQISVIAPDGTMNENAGAYAGQDRFQARKQILKDLQALGLLKSEQKKVISVPRCYRSHDIVEPYLSDQWFVKMKPLAEPAINVVREGKIRFYPKHWEETYFHWMENIRDWCISRQIWWGHRIPVWYCENGHHTVSRQTPEVCAECGSTQLRQDKDVLDTWFSSWLWPFSTLGWPEDTKDLKVFFPTDTLATGPDIIFFWVARMIMASLEFMHDIPFTDVYFNGMIRDLNGKKMSKSLGNSPDPLWLINGAEPQEMQHFIKDNPTYKKGVPAYGADAVRMTMLYSTPLGGDVHFDHTSVELGQRFSNKLWNAVRFVLMNLDEKQELIDPTSIKVEELDLSDRWIISRLYKTIKEIDSSLKEFRLNEAAHSAYQFVWSEFCDWYVEWVKLRFYNNDDPSQQKIARSVSYYIIDNIVRILHPMMPFITEEIWQAFPGNENARQEKRSIMQQPYPQVNEEWYDDDAENAFSLLQKIIGAIRNIRGEMNIPPGKQAELVINTTHTHKKQIVQANETAVIKLSRLQNLTYSDQRPELSASAVVQGIELYMPLADLIDIDVEKERLGKEIARLEKQLVGLNQKLTNEKFISRAPREVVEKEQQKKADWEINLNKLQKNLEMLS